MIRKKIYLLTAVLFACISLLNAQENILKRVLALIDEGKSEEAVAVLKDELSKDAENPDVHLSLGIVYLERNEFEKSEQALLKTLELQPGSVVAYYTLAMLYEKQDKLGEAKEMWMKVLENTEEEDLKDLSDKHIRQIEEVGR